jgi:quercetin dioxygenase-like cupin family protein
MARAQPPAAPAAPAASAAHTVARELMRRDVIGLPGKEAVLSTVEVPAGVSSAPHRHDAQVFVYVLQGRMIMQVKGGPRLTLGPGQTFYESPSDIHTVSANASKTEPAKFLAFLIKDKGKPGLIPVAPDQARSQSPAASAPDDRAQASPPGAPAPHAALMSRDLIGLPGKEVVMSVIEQPPGARGKPHRHYAQVFVYVLQGRVIMQVKGGPRLTLGPGQTFYEDPADIHTVSANASSTEPAKFLAILIKDKGRPITFPVPPGRVQ